MPGKVVAKSAETTKKNIRNKVWRECKKDICSQKCRERKKNIQSQNWRKCQKNCSQKCRDYQKKYPKRKLERMPKKIYAAKTVENAKDKRQIDVKKCICFNTCSLFCEWCNTPIQRKKSVFMTNQDDDGEQLKVEQEVKLDILLFFWGAICYCLLAISQFLCVKEMTNMRSLKLERRCVSHLQPLEVTIAHFPVGTRTYPTGASTLRI